jgi:hypothetical protein
VESKKKYCSGCDSEQYIWKNDRGVKYCKSCWSCHKSKDTTQKPKTTPLSSKLKQKSDKQKAIDKAYTLMRKVYMTQNPLCNIKIPGICTGLSCDVHHMEGRGIQTLVQATWVATCRECHSWCHLNPLEARELGFLK